MSICVVLGNCIYIPDTIRSKESDKEIGREFSCGTNEIVFFFVLRETHYLSGIKRISLSDHGKKGCTYSMLHGRENKKSPIKQPKCSGCFFFFLDSHSWLTDYLSEQLFLGRDSFTNLSMGHVDPLSTVHLILISVVFGNFSHSDNRCLHITCLTLVVLIWFQKLTGC